MKKLLMIGTGGTIASEMTPDGLTPGLSPERLLQFVPAIRAICEVDCVSVFSEDSTNITPAHWVAIAEAVRDGYDSYDGFVISHGTDTMAYTAAALSYLVQDSGKPIVLTGAQKPIYFDSTDSKTNLWQPEGKSTVPVPADNSMPAASSQQSVAMDNSPTEKQLELPPAVPVAETPEKYPSQPTPVTESAPARAAEAVAPPPVSPPVKQHQLPDTNKQQLMQSAGKILRQ